MNYCTRCFKYLCTVYKQCHWPESPAPSRKTAPTTCTVGIHFNLQNRCIKTVPMTPNGGDVHNMLPHRRSSFFFLQWIGCRNREPWQFTTFLHILWFKDYRATYWPDIVEEKFNDHLKEIYRLVSGIWVFIMQLIYQMAQTEVGNRITGRVSCRRTSWIGQGRVDSSRGIIVVLLRSEQTKF